MKKIAVIALSLSLFFISCKKDNKTIEIESPRTKQEINKEQKILVELNAYGNYKVSGTAVINALSEGVKITSLVSYLEIEQENRLGLTNKNCDSLIRINDIKELGALTTDPNGNGTINLDLKDSCLNCSNLSNIMNSNLIVYTINSDSNLDIKACGIISH